MVLCIPRFRLYYKDMYLICKGITQTLSKSGVAKEMVDDLNRQ